MDEDNERLKIRDELSSMSFEELLKLKNEIGSKLYSETVLGASPKNKISKSHRKTENKNHPCEMSSKYQVPLLNNNVTHGKLHVRDPRFDPLCGTFDKQIFRKNYKFVNDIKAREYMILKNEYKESEDPKQKAKIKRVMERMRNQDREERNLRDKEKKQQDETVSKIQMVKEGKKVVFKKKSERKMEELMNQYDELKKSGKLKKHIQKQHKKHKIKDKKKLSNFTLED